MLPNKTEDGGRRTEDRFAVALNEQGRFAATIVGDFSFVPEANRHIWQGRVCTTAAELAECVNGAVKSIGDFGDPFRTIEVVAVGHGAEDRGRRTEDSGDKDSLIESLKQANAELRAVISGTKANVQPRIAEGANVQRPTSNVQCPMAESEGAEGGRRP